MRFPGTAATHSKPSAEPPGEPVPERYQGVWSRTLLETPEGRDTTTYVRWLQTGLWHADLRVPESLDRSQPEGLAQQQGFCGITHITPAQGNEGEQPEVCRWLRRHDFQPPRSTPDAGTMTFETPDRVIERGVHGAYLEVWERLPESLGRRIALQRLDTSGQVTTERLLVTGQCLMHVRPRSALWPEGMAFDQTLAEVMQNHPTLRPALLDFEISHARQNTGQWTVEKSTLPALEGTLLAFEPERLGDRRVRFAQGPWAGEWDILEWRPAV